MNSSVEREVRLTMIDALSEQKNGLSARIKHVRESKKCRREAVHSPSDTMNAVVTAKRKVAHGTNQLGKRMHDRQNALIGTRRRFECSSKSREKQPPCIYDAGAMLSKPGAMPAKGRYLANKWLAPW